MLYPLYIYISDNAFYISACVLYHLFRGGCDLKLKINLYRTEQTVLFVFLLLHLLLRLLTHTQKKNIAISINIIPSLKGNTICLYIYILVFSLACLFFLVLSYIFCHYFLCNRVFILSLVSYPFSYTILRFFLSLSFSFSLLFPIIIYESI